MRLALSSVRVHRFGFVGSLLAVLLATSLITACAALMESGFRAVPQVDRFGAAALVVRTDDSLELTTVSDGVREVSTVGLDTPPPVPDGTAERVAAVDGVAGTVGDTPFLAQAVSGRGPVPTAPDGGPSHGHAWEAAALTPYELRAGKAPDGDRDVVLDVAAARRGGLSVGDEVTVVAAEGTAVYTVSGTAAPRGRDELPSQTALFFSAAEAERLAGERSQYLGVLAEDGVSAPVLAERMRDALAGTDLEVLTGSAKSKEGSPETADRLFVTTLMFGSVGGIAGFVAAFVIAGAFGLAVLQRTREIAMLRAIGTTPRQIRRMVNIEALMVAVVALVPGCLLAIPMARALSATLVAQDVAPPEFRAEFTWLSFVIGAGAGLALTLLSAWSVTRRISKIGPAEALAEADRPTARLPRTRLVIGVLMALGAPAVAAYGVWIGADMGAALQSLVVMMLMTAAALLAPPLARPLIRMVGAPITRLTGVTGELADANSRSAVRRVASASSAVMLSVAMACMTILVTGALQNGTVDQSRERLLAGQVVVGAGGGELPASVVEAVREAAGAGAVVSPTRSASFITPHMGGTEAMAAQAVDPATVGKVLDLGVEEGRIEDLGEPGAVAVSSTLARQRGYAIGDTVIGWFPDGARAERTVRAVYDRGLGFGDVLLPESAFRGHLAESLVSSVLVKGGKTLEPGSLSTPTAAVLSAGDYSAALKDAYKDSNRGTYLALGILVAFTALAVVNTLVMGTAARSRELAMLRVVGTTRAQITAMVGLETLVVVVIGALVGTAAALVGLAGAGSAVTGGFALPVPWGEYGLVVAGVGVLGVLAALLPAAVAVRARPAEALRY
nr:ABC transporter permease [Streptomyces scabichelini]